MKRHIPLQSVVPAVHVGIFQSLYSLWTVHVVVLIHSWLLKHYEQCISRQKEEYLPCPKWSVSFVLILKCILLPHLSSASKLEAFTEKPCSVCFHCKKMTTQKIERVGKKKRKSPATQLADKS